MQIAYRVLDPTRVRGRLRWFRRGLLVGAYVGVRAVSLADQAAASREASHLRNDIRAQEQLAHRTARVTTRGERG